MPLGPKVLGLHPLLLLSVINLATFLEDLSIYQSCIHSIKSIWGILVRKQACYFGEKDLFEELFHLSNSLLCGRPSREVVLSSECIEGCLHQGEEIQEIN